MYKIAFLTFNWDFDLCSDYNQGIIQFLEENRDTNVYTFNGFGKYGQWTPDTGNFEIYNLPAISSFDGFLIQGNRSWPQEMRQELVDQMYRMGKPCVSMNYRLNHAYYVGTDNVQTEYEYVMELLKRHSVQSIAFVRGYYKSSEAQDREKGFLRAVKEAGINDVRMYDASWNIEEGMQAAEKMLAEKREPADLIVCANDDLALAVQTVFQKHGVMIPEEAMICGFDNTTKASGAEPRITSVDRNYAEIARRSLHVLIDIIQGKQVEKETYSPYRIAYGGSTSDLNSMTELQAVKRKYISIHDELSWYYQKNDDFFPMLNNAENMFCLFDGVEHLMEYLRCQNCFLMIDHRYFEDMENADALMHYSQTMDLCACQHPGSLSCANQNHIYLNFSRTDILPEVFQKGSGHLFEIYALRYTHTIGYLITDGLSPVTRYNLMELLIHTIENAIENMRREMMLKKSSERFGSLYVKDQLTGLYNRFGLESVGNPLYNTLLKEHGEAWICFVDIDDMKHINDLHGHEAGDQAIQDTAMILKRAVKNKNAFFMRYGGDEFVIITDHPCSEAIMHALSEYHHQAKRSFHLSLSAGDYCSSLDNRLIVERCIRLADENMYRVKKEHHEAEAVA